MVRYVSNKIIRYTSKDYESIKDDLVDSIDALSATWTSREDGDAGMVLVKLMSALGDMLSYNLDKQALEYYAPTVTQRKNASKLFDLVSYKMRWYRSATTQVTLTYQAVLSEEMDIYHSAETLVNNLIKKYSKIPENNPGDGTWQECQALVNRYIQHYEGVTSPTYYIPYDNETSSHEWDVDYATSITWDEAVSFLQLCVSAFDYWKTDSSNSLDISETSSSNLITSYLYGNGGGAISYILDPIVNVNTLDTSKHIRLQPYVPTKFKAIEGSIKSVQFTADSINDNCYYIPLPDVDDEHMYVLWESHETLREIKKVDNLLTYIDPQADENGNPEVCFEFKVDDFDYPYIELSNYWKQVLGTDGTFTLHTIQSSGSGGNITKDYLTSISVPSGYVAVSNMDNNEFVVDSEKTICSPGFNPQSARDAYIDSLNYIMTYNTLVTIYDFARFTRRQDMISNAIAIDCQYASDLNKAIDKECDTYTIEQLEDILGVTIPEKTDENLFRYRKYLKNIRHVNYKYEYSKRTKQDNEYNYDVPDNDFVVYTLNMYPIVNDFQTEIPASGDEDQPKIIAEFVNFETQPINIPYKIYKLYNPSVVADNLSAAYKSCRILNIEPSFQTGVRVFDWRCCGCIHLTKSVNASEAASIVAAVVTALKVAFAPQNLTIGKKISYMEVLDVITNCDNRIRYFEGGIGKKSMIYFTPSYEEKYFNTEAYFNPESIMRYVQTVDEITSDDGEYKNMIYVDPSYIQGDSV